MKLRRTATILTATLVAPILLTATPANAVWKSSHRAPAVVIHEDDPRWDCTTMGNRTCGVQDASGTWFLVKHNRKGIPVSISLRPAR